MGLQVPQEHEFRIPVALRKIGLENLEDIEPRVQGLGGIEIETVTARPMKSLSVGQLDSRGINSPLLEKFEVLSGKVFTHYADAADGREQAGSQREIVDRATEDFFNFSKRCFDRIEGHGPDGNNRGHMSPWFSSRPLPTSKNAYRLRQNDFHFIPTGSRPKFFWGKHRRFD